jgi:hypothetical protein
MWHLLPQYCDELYARDAFAMFLAAVSSAFVEVTRRETDPAND